MTQIARKLYDVVFVINRSGLEESSQVGELAMGGKQFHVFEQRLEHQTQPLLLQHVELEFWLNMCIWNGRSGAGSFLDLWKRDGFRGGLGGGHHRAWS